MTPSTTRRVGRRRWAELVRFLTTTMKTSGSERVRMAAAERLCEILIVREQKEIAELRAAAKNAGNTPVLNTGDESPAPVTPAVTVSAEEAAEAFLANLRTKREVMTGGQ